MVRIIHGLDTVYKKDSQEESKYPMRPPSFILILVICFGCDRKELKLEYFDNGNIKRRYYLLNGLKEGKEIIYLEDGKISGTAEWKEGEKNGLLVVYYSNGTIAIIENYYNGIIVDKSEYFGEDGKLREIHYFDSNGRMVDFRKYDNSGDRIDKMALIPWIKPDSVTHGDSISLELSLGNMKDLRLNSGVLIICSDFIYDVDGNPDYVKDTLEVISSEMNYYSTKRIADHMGINYLRGMLICKLGKAKEDSIYNFYFERSYFVK